MKPSAVLVPAVLCALVLSACAEGSVSGVIDSVKDTASGALKEASLVKERAEAEAKAAKERVDNVKEGIDKINEGRELLKQGLTGTGSNT